MPDDYIEVNVDVAEHNRWLLNISEDNYDEVHQTIISEETMLTIYNDGTKKDNDNRNITLAFTVRTYISITKC